MGLRGRQTEMQCPEQEQCARAEQHPPTRCVREGQKSADSAQYQTTDQFAWAGDQYPEQKPLVRPGPFPSLGTHRRCRICTSSIDACENCVLEEYQWVENHPEAC